MLERTCDCHRKLQMEIKVIQDEMMKSQKSLLRDIENCENEKVYHVQDYLDLEHQPYRKEVTFTKAYWFARYQIDLRLIECYHLDTDIMQAAQNIIVQCKDEENINNFYRCDNS